MNNTLESYKFFPYVAWALVIGFALFTYSLTVRLQENLTAVDISIENLEMRVGNLEQRATDTESTN